MHWSRCVDTACQPPVHSKLTTSTLSTWPIMGIMVAAWPSSLVVSVLLVTVEPGGRVSPLTQYSGLPQLDAESNSPTATIREILRIDNFSDIAAKTVTP